VDLDAVWGGEWVGREMGVLDRQRERAVLVVNFGASHCSHHFSYSKAAKYLMHSTEECATSSVHNSGKTICCEGSDALFPNYFGEDLFFLTQQKQKP